MTARVNVVVTGSTRGIGKGLANEILKRGHNVVVNGRTTQAVDATIAELTPSASDGARAAGIPCDVSKGEDLQRLWDTAVVAFGRIDIWINNAGISHPRQRAGEMREQDINSVQEINLLGMMLATKIALLGMRAQGGGTIFNMEGFGSNGMVTPGMGLYGASKFALTYFNKALVSETGDGPVKVCYLSPGIVITDLVKRDMGSTTAKEIERTRRIYSILADRVETVTPWLADRILQPQKTGARVAWLTRGKAGRRFFMSLFRKRSVLKDADFTN
ncbi:MAG: SDR family oxidoreductase [Gammaproteobacteria bacterium]|nr:SDR family oxidoreductase [Gammaproteobacteria bacterium]